MAGVSDGAFDRGDLPRRLSALEARIRALEKAQRLRSSSIGSGGLRIVEGGSITVDPGGDIIIRGGRIISGEEDGERAEMTPTGYRLVNEDNEIVIDLTTNGVNQVLLRGGDQEDAVIQLSADGSVSCRQLNAEQIFINGKEIDSGELPEVEGTGTPGPNKKEYVAEWSQSYRLADGRKNTFDPTPVQGFYSSTNGNQRSLIGFDSAQIQADLAAATSVDTVRVKLYYNHWYFGSGGTAIIGWHSHTDEPGSFSATTDQIRVPDWPKPGSRWVDLPTSGWDSGSKKGIAIGPGPSTNKIYYGRCHGHAQANPPVLEITWTQ